MHKVPKTNPPEAFQYRSEWEPDALASYHDFLDPESGALDALLEEVSRIEEGLLWSGRMEVMLTLLKGRWEILGSKMVDRLLTVVGRLRERLQAQPENEALDELWENYGKGEIFSKVAVSCIPRLTTAIKKDMLERPELFLSYINRSRGIEEDEELERKVVIQSVHFFEKGKLSKVDFFGVLTLYLPRGRALPNEVAKKLIVWMKRGFRYTLTAEERELAAHGENPDLPDHYSMRQSIGKVFSHVRQVDDEFFEDMLEIFYSNVLICNDILSDERFTEERALGFVKRANIPDQLIKFMYNYPRLLRKREMRDTLRRLMPPGDNLALIPQMEQGELEEYLMEITQAGDLTLLLWLVESQGLGEGRELPRWFVENCLKHTNREVRLKMLEVIGMDEQKKISGSKSGRTR